MTIQITPKRVAVRGHVAFEQDTQKEWFCNCPRGHVHEAVFPGQGKVRRIYSSYMDAIRFMYVGDVEGHPVS